MRININADIFYMSVLLFFEYFYSFMFGWIFTAAWAFLWLRWAAPLWLLCADFLRWLLWSWNTGSRACGLQQLQLQDWRAQAQHLGLTGLVASWHVGSCWTRDPTRVSCIGRWILYHWVTSKAQHVSTSWWFMNVQMLR